jgi:predicted P-loop ATPase
MSDELHPDAERAIAFLSWLNAGAGLYLEHMRSEGAAMPTAKPYPAHDTASAKRFVSANNGEGLRRNIYFLPNGEFLAGNRAKANLTAARFLHVDLDCKDYQGTEEEQSNRIIGLLLEMRQRPKGIPAPSAVWFTGGGYQAVWRMAESIPIEEAEDLNRALLSAFQGGPGTHDPSRLLRLPWTVNWLNDKKRKDGRTPARAFLMEPANLGAPPTSYSPGYFKLWKSKVATPAVPSQASALSALAELQPLPLPDDLAEVLPSDPDWARAIAEGENPRGKHYVSRSELVLASVIWMLGNDVEPGHVLSIITNPRLGIGAHVRDQPDPLRYARRQVQRAMEMIAIRRLDWPQLTEKGAPIENHPDNIRYALGRLGIDSRRNRFINADEVTGLGLDDRDLNDIGEILSSHFHRELEFKASRAAVKRELMAIAHEQSYHPVIDYLDGLEWDGTPRLDTWLRDYCGAEDTDLNREFGAKFLIAGVRRIRQPGIKFDTMLVMEGTQGIDKSGVAETLAIRDEWFCGSLSLRSDDKTKAELLARAWIVECQEMDGMNKATSQELKRFLSTRIDVYRRAYGHEARSYRRHCIIIGTTNEDAYLRDPTGNRRFWPVRCGTIDLARLKADVHQLWAEAVAREKAGETITLSPELRDAAGDLQQVRVVEDPYAVVLEEFAERTGRVSMDSVKLLLGYEGGKMTPAEAQRIRVVMERLGWQYGTHRLHGLGQTPKIARRGFARGTQEEREAEWIAERRPGGPATLALIVRADDDGPPPF